MINKEIIEFIIGEVIEFHDKNNIISRKMKEDFVNDIAQRLNHIQQWIIATPENLPSKMEVWESDLGQNAKVALWNGKQPILVSNNFKPSEDGFNGYTHYINLPTFPKATD